MHILIQTIFTNGERFPMLVNEVGVPDFWSTLFISHELRELTQSSITARINNIRHFYKWERINNRSIINDFEDSIVPGSKFVESLKEHCGLSSEHIDKELLQKSIVKTVSFQKLKLARLSALSQVSCDYQQRRMHDISTFLLFVGRAILKKKRNQSELLAELNILEKTIVANFPKSSFSRHNKQLPHAEKETFDKFLEIFHPDSNANPFIGYDLKLRNYLLVQLLYWTGARSGEILSLSLDDIDYDVNIPKVKITRTHDDVADCRKNQPVTKTRSREIIIPTWLRNELDYYIHKVRNKYPLSKKHPYIFVSHKGLTKGHPVTNSTFYNRVIFDVKALNLDSFKLIKRHGFRHLFNASLSEKIDAHNEKIQLQIAEAEISQLPRKVAQLKKELISEQQEVEIRMGLMGHSSEESARPYLERHVKKKAQQFHKTMMQDMSEIMKNARSN
jgi:integrase